ncbi:MAG: glycosyltransferase family 39 protein, partial [Terriglobus sp.]
MPAQPKPIRHAATVWDGPLCVLAWLVAALLTRPFVDSGLIDDFSYVKSAFVFADTHRLAYNGWATATIGWQIVWGGIFAQVFGHTYSAVRLANFVTSFATVWVAHASFIRSGLSRRNAIVGALALALCPLFLPMSISFMSDISGLFSILICYYCCLRALQSQRDSQVLTWLVAAGLLSIVGSTARQIAWMSPLVMVPS